MLVCYLILILKHDHNFFSRAVTFATSTKYRFSHVDIVVHNPDDGENILRAYSSFMNTLLTKTELARNHYHDDCDVALAVPVTAGEARTARDFLDKLVQNKTPYNTADIALCLLPVRAQQYVKDVAPDAPIRSVFCSQLAVLTLRRSLTKSARSVLQCCQAVNSRCTSPNALFGMLSPLCTRVRVQALCTGQVQPVTKV